MTKVYKCHICSTVAMSKDYADYDNPVCGLCGLTMTPVSSTVEDAPEVFAGEAYKSLCEACQKREPHNER